jgi:hypothetical protein
MKCIDNNHDCVALRLTIAHTATVRGDLVLSFITSVVLSFPYSYPAKWGLYNMFSLWYD